jgi:hypothetical protein
MLLLKQALMTMGSIDDNGNFKLAYTNSDFGNIQN